MRETGECVSGTVHFLGGTMVHFRGVTEGTEERHACTVCAVSTAAEIPYADAHALLAACGRRRGHKFNFRGFMSGRYKLGSYSVTAVCMPLVSPTLAQVVKDFP